MYKRVLVPLDGSEFAESALPLAAAVSRGSGATLELVSAYDPLPPPLATGEDASGLTVPVRPDALGAVPITTGEMRESLREERTTYLHDAARRLRDGTGVEADVILLEGRADRAIKARANETGADLVVMATHGRGPVERAWLGSVADRLVRDMPVPILLVRPVDGEAVDLATPATVGQVVVALDGSELAEAVLDPALALSTALSAPMALVRVVGTRLDIGSPYIPHAAQAHREHVAEEREDAEGYLERVRDGLAGKGADIVSVETPEGPAARSIIGVADAARNDVVAMATHGRGGLRRLVLGSVSDKVVRSAAGPVLVVRPEGED
jgi:nucleotide-binding universal stress UspA family protein